MRNDQFKSVGIRKLASIGRREIERAEFFRGLKYPCGWFYREATYALQRLSDKWNRLGANLGKLL